LSRRSHRAERTGAGSSEDGVLARSFFSAVDRAADIQGPVIEKYVGYIRRRHGGKSSDDQQKVIDRHFLTIATGTGAGTGALAFFPGVGTLFALGTAGGEALGILEAFALYTLASGNDVISGFAGAGGVTGLARLARLPRGEKQRLNSRLGRMAFRQARRRLAAGAFQKMLPLGVGAVLGARANHKLARAMVAEIHRSLH